MTANSITYVLSQVVEGNMNICFANTTHGIEKG